jgi:hypothetical protein
MLSKFHIPAIIGALTSAIGILSSPAILGMLGVKGAAIVTAAGVIIQAFTKPVVKTPE